MVHDYRYAAAAERHRQMLADTENFRRAQRRDDQAGADHRWIPRPP
jgi:hypothetical protein